MQLADGRIGEAMAACSVNAAASRFLHVLELNFALHHRVGATRIEDRSEFGGVDFRRADYLSDVAGRVARELSLAGLGVLSRKTRQLLAAVLLGVAFVATPVADNFLLSALLLLAASL